MLQQLPVVVYNCFLETLTTFFRCSVGNLHLFDCKLTSIDTEWYHLIPISVNLGRKCSGKIVPNYVI